MGPLSVFEVKRDGMREPAQEKGASQYCVSRRGAKPSDAIGELPARVSLGDT